jgi:signal transduction histidine kinase
MFIAPSPQKSGFHASLWPGFVLAVLLWLIGAPLGYAQTELIERVEILEDPTAALTVDQIDMDDFRPAGLMFTEGYTSSAVWLRLKVRGIPGRDDHVLIVRPTTLDKLSLYIPDSTQAGGWHVTHLGGRSPVRDEQWASSLRGFRINPVEDGGVYLLRVATTGSMGVVVTALVEAEAERMGLLIDLRQISYLSVMLVLMIWALRMAVLTKEPQFGWFAAMQGLWTVHNAFHFGYMTIFSSWFQDEHIFVVHRGLVILMSLLTIRFHKAVLVRFAPPPAARLLLDLLMVIMGCALALYVLGYSNAALKLNALAIASTPVVLIVNAFSARKNASPGLITMRVIYAILSATLSIWILALIGVADVGVYSAWGVLIHGLVTGMLMFSILHLHGKNLLADAVSAKVAIVKSEERRRFEQEQNRMLVRFIDMLTHETKNAMAVINMSASAPNFGPRQRDRVEMAIRDLTTVIDRCSQSLRMDTKEQVIAKEACDAAVILRDLCRDNPGTARIHLTAPPEAPLHSDPVLLRVVFGNLIENALKYSPPKSMVHVAIQQEAMGQLVIWFENEAGTAGLPDPARVFEKYYRSDRALSQIGSGLGLYLVQGVVRNLGGGISYEPEEGRARFRLWLPC